SNWSLPDELVTRSAFSSTPSIGGKDITSYDSRAMRDSDQTSASERAPGPTYFALGRTSTPSRFCSSTCADQPAVREHANIAGASAGGTSATSRTTADQNSTFV